MATESGTRGQGKVRRRAALLVVAVALTALAAACDAPAPPAGSLFDAWKANNMAAANAVATPGAVGQIFSQPYSSASDWTFVRCDGAAGSTYCTWVDTVENRLQMRIDNMTNKVSEVLRIPVGSTIAGRVFHAWRKGTSDAATPYATPGAKLALFSKTYSTADHWLPSGCDGAAGHLYCTWTNDAAETIVLGVNNVVVPMKVDQVLGTY
ncbi:MAG TPA: hypothetical protein VGO60_18100 [Iamia sp.]|jgi:hypothetical protein|nr:hypothetical protein [Iamia sp.]